MCGVELWIVNFFCDIASKNGSYESKNRFLDFVPQR